MVERVSEHRRDAMRLKKALQFLDLPAYATVEEVRARYKDLIRKSHPDKGGDPETFRRVQECYDLLVERVGKRERASNRREPARRGPEEAAPVRAVRQGEDQKQVVISSDLKDLGDAAFERGEHEDAIDYYNAAAAYSRIDSLVSFAELLFARARAYSAVGEATKAISDLKRSAEMRPIWADPPALLGRLHLRREEWVLARESLERAAQLAKPGSEAWERISDDLAAARKALEEAYCVCALSGHGGEVSSVSFLPSSPLLKDSVGAALEGELVVASGSADGTARIWSLRRGECLHVLRGHSGPVRGVAWCPDGSGILLSASADGSAKIWQLDASAEGCTLLKSVEGHTAALTHVSFDTYGAVFATTSEDGEACVWDTETGLLLHRLEGHAGRVNKGVFHPANGGRSLCTASDDTTAKVWDLAGDVEEAGKCIHTLEWGDGLVNDVEYTPDGRFIVVVTRKPGSVKPFFRLLLFSSVSGRICRWFDGHSATITGLSWNPSQAEDEEVVTLATSSRDGTLRLWEMAPEPTGAGAHLLESDEFQGRSLNQWEVSQCGVCHDDIERVHEGALLCVAYSPNGDLICAAGLDKHVRIFDGETLECLQDCGCHGASVKRLAWSGNSSLVVSASSDHCIKVWNVSLPE